MSFKNLTWPQVAILCACLGATFGAYKFLGTEAGGMTAIVTTLLTFLLGREPPKDPPSSIDQATSKSLLGVIIAIAMAASVTQLEACKLHEFDQVIAPHVDTIAKLSECRNQGREAGSYSAYEACKEDAGVQ